MSSLSLSAGAGQLAGLSVAVVLGRAAGATQHDEDGG